MSSLQSLTPHYLSSTVKNTALDGKNTALLLIFVCLHLITGNPIRFFILSSLL